MTTATPIRFVELIRVSGADQAARDTPADQRQALDRLRETRPGVLVEVLQETNGISGAKPLNERPDLLRLVELAKRKAFDELRVRHLDRLTRHPDPRERYAVFGAVADAGAVIVDAGGHVIDPTSELGELDFGFQSLVAARERRRITERTLAGRRRLAGEGKLQGRRPWARTWDGSSWGVVEEQVKVYARLFNEVIAGKSLHQVAAGLNAEKVPAPGGGRWSAGGVSRLIKHPSAIGEVACFGATLSCPPITDRATWERANTAIKWSRAGRPPRLDPAAALVRGVASCGSCGSALWVDTAANGSGRRIYYRCKHSKLARTPECRSYYNVETVDGLVRAALMRWLAADVVRKAKAGPDPAKLAEKAKARLRSLAVEEERVLRVARTAASPAALEKVLKELGQEREQVKRELEAAKLAAKSTPTPLAAERRRELLERARAATPAQLRELVKSILRPGDVKVFEGPRIEVRPGGGR